MPPLHDHMPCPQVPDDPRRLLHVGKGRDPDPGEDLGLGDVRREDKGERNQLRDQGLLGLLADQRHPPLGHHHRIDDELLDPVLADLPGHDPDDLRSGQHPRLGRIDPDVGRHRIELRRDELRRHVVDAVDPEGVLGGERRDDAHPESAEDRDRLQIRLDPRPAAGIRSGDRQYPDRFHLSDLPRENPPAGNTSPPGGHPESISMIPCRAVRRLLIPQGLPDLHDRLRQGIFETRQRDPGGIAPRKGGGRRSGPLPRREPSGG